MKWIKCSDRLPEINKPVLCNFKHWNIQIDRQIVVIRVNGSDCMWKIWDTSLYLYEMSHDFDVTHWQPLPEPPKKEEGK